MKSQIRSKVPFCTFRWPSSNCVKLPSKMQITRYNKTLVVPSYIVLHDVNYTRSGRKHHDTKGHGNYKTTSVVSLMFYV